MEGLKKADPNLTNQALADRVGLDRSQVSKALRLMVVLSPSVRAGVRNLITTTPDLADFLDSFETAALELGVLGYKQVLADQLGMNPTVISRAERVTGLLNQVSRALILQNLQNGQEIRENAIFRLTDLGDEDLIEKALPVLLEGQMTEPLQAKKLVVWVGAGNEPADFSYPKTLQKPPQASRPQEPPASAPAPAMGGSAVSNPLVHTK